MRTNNSSVNVVKLDDSFHGTYTKGTLSFISRISCCIFIVDKGVFLHQLDKFITRIKILDC